MLKLSVIIPVYQVEKYIRTCIDSIYQQGLNENDFEVIIINDGTKDRSMEMIADSISQHNNITVINQENQGLSVARNKGLKKAQGEYILMLDSDDLLIRNCIKPLLEMALLSKTDMVIADYIQMDDLEIEKYLKQESLPTIHELKYKETTGVELLDESLCRYYWRYIFRKEFLETNRISFIPGITAQDVPFTNECLLKSKSCIRAIWPMIIYRWGHISTTYSTYTLKKAKDLSTVIAKIWELSQMDSLSDSTRRKQKDIVFRYFYSFTYKITYGHIKDISQVIEAIDYMKQLAPEMKFENNLKQRLYTLAYQNLPHIFIKLKYYFETGKRYWHNQVKG